MTTRMTATGADSEATNRTSTNAESLTSSDLESVEMARGGPFWTGPDVVVGA